MSHANLTPERGPNVWARQAEAAHARDTAERAVIGGAGFVLLLLGLGRRTPSRRLVAAAGAGLLALAGAPRGMRRVREWADRRRWRRTYRDVVTDQSAQSFPASDAPTWTPTTGSAASSTAD